MSPLRLRSQVRLVVIPTIMQLVPMNAVGRGARITHVSPPFCKKKKKNHKKKNSLKFVELCDDLIPLRGT